MLFRSVTNNILVVLGMVLTYFHDLLGKIYIYAQDRMRTAKANKSRSIEVDKTRSVIITKDDLV